MFGTVAICKVKAENVAALRAVFADDEVNAVDGYLGTDVMVPENRDDELIMVVRFRDRESYFANAEDPAQGERYLAFRALMEADPVWHDGEWISG